jgi:hypothetical protein
MVIGFSMLHPSRLRKRHEDGAVAEVGGGDHHGIHVRQREQFAETGEGARRRILLSRDPGGGGIEVLPPDIAKATI